MTGEPALHLGSEAEKNIPRPQQLHGMCPRVPNMKLLCGSSSRRVQTSALSQREPAQLAASPGPGGAESCVWPQDVLFWPASFR